MKVWICELGWYDRSEILKVFNNPIEAWKYQYKINTIQKIKEKLHDDIETVRRLYQKLYPQYRKEILLSTIIKEKYWEIQGNGKCYVIEKDVK